jgi:hypothetical protein
MSYINPSLLDAVFLVAVMVAVMMAARRMAAMLLMVQYRLRMAPRSVAAMPMAKPLALQELELGTLKVCFVSSGAGEGAGSAGRSGMTGLYAMMHALPLQRRL